MKKLILIWLAVITFVANAQRTIYAYGKIYTSDTTNQWVEAMVIEGNRIVMTGTTKAAMQWKDAHSNFIDLKQKLVLPGFIDNHTHFMLGGYYLLGIDLHPAKSVAEFRSILKAYTSAHSGEWVTGGNWDHEGWDIKNLPVRQMIDDVTGTSPVFVQRMEGHMAIANSRALRLAGITRDTPSPEGGVIVKDPITGEPTGLLKDNAMDLVYRIIPAASDAENDRAARRALKEAARLGVTTVHDITGIDDLKTYQRLEKNGELTCRIYTRLPISNYQSLVGAGIQFGFGSDKLKLGSLKAFADGALGSSTALFYDPYLHEPDTRGLPMDILSNGNLRRWAMDADKNKLQLSIHAIGDSANAEVLKIFEEIVKVNPAWDRRFRIEHAQHVRPDALERYKKLGVIASVQPYHAIDDGVWAVDRIGDRIRYTYAFKSFMDAGITTTFGSDWTVAPLNPLLGIYAACTRQTLDGKNKNGWQPQEKVSVEQAVKSYTINNAFASFEEKEKGSLVPGKYADFVVLSEDIFTIAPERIKEVTVLLTIVGGNIVYAAAQN
jgi:predicted amidohydrolase YtcJ